MKAVGAVRRFLLAMALLALGAWVPASASAAGGSFGAATNYAADNGPSSVAIGDFNADFDPDLAVSNALAPGEAVVSVLVGGAGGSFGAATNFPAGCNFPNTQLRSCSQWIAAADFNGDSDLDLVVANFDSNNVAVLLGGAGGSFGPATSFPVGDGPTSVAVGDFNGDSDPDLAVANGSFFGPGDVSVLLGGAGGSFGAPTNFPAGHGPSSVAIGDFNGDSDPDLATANFFAGDVSVLLGGAGGSFGAPTSLVAGGGPISVAVGDFNGDSDPDLAVGNLNSNDVSVLLGGAGGSFAPAANFPADEGPRGVAVGNFNGDSDPDIAVVNLFSSDVSVLLGGAGGSFGPAANFPTGANPWSVAVADFNGDSDPDLAVANNGSDNVSILLGTNAPEVTIDDVSNEEGNAGSTTYTFTLGRTGNTAGSSRVHFATADGSATVADDDYETASGDVTFASGEIHKTFQVAVNGDTKIEADEQFNVNLSGGVNAAIVDSQAAGTIRNDDLSPSQPCTILGTSGADVLSGGSGDDVICAGSGDDQVFGGGGRDVLIGGNGRDLMDGGSGSDLLLGGGGYDDLRGGDGNDNLRGEEGGDTLTGQAGSDALFGQTGLDTVNTKDGISGNDSGDGGVGSDKCSSDPGDFLTACP